MTVFLLAHHDDDGFDESVHLTLDGAKAMAVRNLSVSEDTRWDPNDGEDGPQWWPRMGTRLIRGWLPSFSMYDESEEIPPPCYIQRMEVQP